MEIDALYADIVVYRLEQFTGRKAEHIGAAEDAAHAEGRKVLQIPGGPDAAGLPLEGYSPTFSIFQCRSGLSADGSQCMRANLRCQ
jgi:hypothetical protein